MEKLYETDLFLDGADRGADQASTKDTELPFLSRGEHRDAELPDAENPVWGDHLGAAGDQFEKGVHDPEHLLNPAETAAAERLARDGAMVSALHVDAPMFGHVEGLAIVRTSESDAGTPTALVTLEAGSPEAVADALDLASGRLAEVGPAEVVLDGRDAQLTVEAAKAGWEHAKESGHDLPERMHCLLADGDTKTFP